MNSTRRTFMKALGIGTASFTLPSYVHGREDSRQNHRPNMILILTDDHRFDAMGFIGHPFLETPHMDRILETRVIDEQVASNHCPVLRCLNYCRMAKIQGTDHGNNPKPLKPRPWR